MTYDVNTKAVRIFDERVVFGDRNLAELVAWRVPAPVPPSRHCIKYRLAYIVGGVGVIGFDSERGKGDHRHDGGMETPYRFQGVEQLVADFKAAVQAWRTAHGRG